MLTRPDVLVLAAGGILGEAWMSGVLAGAEEAAGLDFRDCDSFVGTSAGAIVSARLAAGEPPRRPRGGGGRGRASDFARDAPADAPSRARGMRRAAQLGAWAATP